MWDHTLGQQPHASLLALLQKGPREGTVVFHRGPQPGSKKAKGTNTTSLSPSRAAIDQTQLGARGQENWVGAVLQT